jgi:phosphate transport system substrate-binding protein
LFLALAAQVPDPKSGKELVPNPYKLWSDINPALSEAKIEVLGPPPTSGTRDAFVELVMEVGCKQFDVIAALEQSNPAAFKRACQTMREDGAFIEAGENDNLIVQKLQANPKAFGIFGYSFLEQNTDKVQGAVIEGAEPTFEAIADGKYPVSRPLYMYIKKSHVKLVPGIQEYIGEFTSEKAWGPEGYLAEKGLIPMPDAEREKVRNDAQDLVALKL